MAWGDENCGGFECFYVDCVGFDDGESVVGDAEEQLVVHGSVDESEEVCLPWPHLQLEGIFS